MLSKVERTRKQCYSVDNINLYCAACRTNDAGLQFSIMAKPRDEFQLELLCHCTGIVSQYMSP